MSKMSEMLLQLAATNITTDVATDGRAGSTDPYTILAIRDGAVGVVREVWPAWSNRDNSENRPERRVDYAFGTIMVDGEWLQSGVVDEVELEVLKDLTEIRVTRSESDLHQIVLDDTSFFLLGRLCATKLGVKVGSSPAIQSCESLMARICAMMNTNTTNGGEMFIGEQSYSMDCSSWRDEYEGDRRVSVPTSYKLRYDPKPSDGVANAFPIAKHKRAVGRVQDRGKTGGGYMSRRSFGS